MSGPATAMLRRGHRRCFLEPTEQSFVDASSPAAEKLALLWSLFGARADVYALRWESASSGKTGWSPAT